MKIFAVFDVKAAAYGTPIFQATPGLALRGFSDACADRESMLFKHPEDYALYELGDYDSNSGKFACHDQPKHLFSASAVHQQLREASRVVPPLSEVHHNGPVPKKGKLTKLSLP